MDAAAEAADEEAEAEAEAGEEHAAAAGTAGMTSDDIGYGAVCNTSVCCSLCILTKRLED